MTIKVKKDQFAGFVGILEDGKKISIREDGKIQYWSDYGGSKHINAAIAAPVMHNTIAKIITEGKLVGDDYVVKKFIEAAHDQ